MIKEMRGRPVGSAERMIQTSFPIDPNQLAAITKIAKRRGQTRSALLRQLIDECLAA